eukprot:TRINITY_DN1045_c0_g1_i1.p2 TRINITY_DN1045_c0_g1~~TRINITY_DN1045_c0_g1_i1.p2  ORF type:complete len:100 (-),score=25.63 TRINITY_DN1045_c0_g1_i1:195-494(-)
MLSRQVLRHAALIGSRQFHAPSPVTFITAKEADRIVYDKFKEHQGQSPSESEVNIAKNNARIYTTNWMLAGFAILGLGFLSYMKFAPHDSMEKSIKRHE